MSSAIAGTLNRMETQLRDLKESKLGFQEQLAEITRAFKEIAKECMKGTDAFSEVFLEYFRYFLDLIQLHKNPITCDAHVSQFEQVTQILEIVFPTVRMFNAGLSISTWMHQWFHHPNQSSANIESMNIFGTLIDVATASGDIGIQDRILELISSFCTEVESESSSTPMITEFFKTATFERIEWILSCFDRNHDISKYDRLRKLFTFNTLASEEVISFFVTAINVGEHTLESIANSDFLVDFILSRKCITFAFNDSSKMVRAVVGHNMVESVQAAMTDQENVVDLKLMLSDSISTSVQLPMFNMERQVKIRLLCSEETKKKLKEVIHHWYICEANTTLVDSDSSNETHELDEIIESDENPEGTPSQLLTCAAGLSNDNNETHVDVPNIAPIDRRSDRVDVSSNLSDDVLNLCVQHRMENSVNLAPMATRVREFRPSMQIASSIPSNKSLLNDKGSLAAGIDRESFVRIIHQDWINSKQIVATDRLNIQFGTFPSMMLKIEEGIRFIEYVRAPKEIQIGVVLLEGGTQKRKKRTHRQMKLKLLCGKAVILLRSDGMSKYKRFNLVGELIIPEYKVYGLMNETSEPCLINYCTWDAGINIFDY